MGWLAPLLDVVLPGTCPGCEGVRGIDDGAGLCRACLALLPELPRAVVAPSTVAGAWVLGPYDGPLGAMIRRGKYAPDPALVDALGRRLARAAAGRLPEVDCVVHVPVPLRRRLERGFDQAQLLAAPVARALGCPHQTALRRVRSGEQAGRKGARRRLEARRSFRVGGRPLPPRVLLVDDVLTTGATASACAGELLAGGAGVVYVLAVAAAPATLAAVDFS